MPSCHCLPPAASGPVRTVRKPTRRFSLCANAPLESTASAASDNRNRSRNP